ncbi:MAG: phosphate ABC transporter ATP-binding protein [Firmicutes bacterium]|nr:phosphate ABC transporter ATP-binding protein [Bacillota bacterium]
MTNPKIVIKNLNFYYGEKQVIHNFSLQIPANEITCVIGPANSGITTLLRSLNRLCDLNPKARAEGEILLNGQNIFDKDVLVTELRRKVGMVFDIPTPLAMSILDNVTYGPRLAGKKTKEELLEIAENALTVAALWDEVKDRLKLQASSLSGGQQQRLCLARVLALDPEVILLDRPCSGLDPISTAKIEGALIQLKSSLTVVLAPHNTQQAVRVSDRVVFMLKGSMIEEGAGDELFYSPKDKRTNDYITGRFG